MKALRWALCALLLALVATLSASAYASQPPVPPGKDPCEHGNATKPCRARPAARQWEGLPRARQRWEERGPLRARESSSSAPATSRPRLRPPPAPPPPAPPPPPPPPHPHHRRRPAAATASTAASASPHLLQSRHRQHRLQPRPPAPPASPPPSPPPVSNPPAPSSRSLSPKPRPKPTPERCFTLKLNVKASQGGRQDPLAPGVARTRPDRTLLQRASAASGSR